MSQKRNKFFIKTFGCVQNKADSERIKAFYWDKSFVEVPEWKQADMVIINSCIVRESAENRTYGLINEINKWDKNPSPATAGSPFEKWSSKKTKIIVTGCLSGLAKRDETGKTVRRLKREFSNVEFMPIEKISFQIEPIRDKKMAALIPISNGCNNFCSYCIVPHSRGKEVSRNFEEIISEVDKVIKDGFKEIVLIGQNVNSYGADLKNPSKSPFDKGDFGFVNMGKKRFRSLFPKLLEEVARKNLEKISFISSNPWDFSDELIDMIKNYKNIERLIHLPIQAGDNEILKKMNRGYTVEEYLKLVKKIRSAIPEIRISTDIIIGFPGEDVKTFEKSLKVYKKANFDIGYLNKYSPRKGTLSAKLYKDEVSQPEKKRRWKILNEIINKRTDK